MVIILYSCSNKENKSINLNQFQDTLTKPYILGNIKRNCYWIKINEPTWNEYHMLFDTGLSLNDTLFIYRLNAFMPFGKPDFVVRIEKYNSKITVTSKRPLQALTQGELKNTKKRDFDSTYKSISQIDFNRLDSIFRCFNQIDYSYVLWPSNIFFDGASYHLQIFRVVNNLRKQEMRYWDFGKGLYLDQESSFNKLVNEICILGEIN